MRTDRARLEDIRELIEQIEQDVPAGRAAFERDSVLQHAIVLRLLWIGEACRSMSQALRDAHPDVPWRDIQAMRNVLTHEYFHIDPQVVWTVVERDLPPLKTKILNLLSQP